MKGVKEIILSLFSVITLGFVSAYAYAGSYNNFGLKGLFQNVPEYVPLAIIFLVIFWVFTFVINRTRIRNGWVLSLILSLFATYGLTKLNIPLENIFYNIGFNEELMLTIGPWIVLGLAMLIVWKWSFGRLLIIFGLIFLALGIFKVASESGAAIMIGAIATLIGLIIYKKEMRMRRRRREVKAMSAGELEEYKEKRGKNRDRRRTQWANAAKITGRGIGWSARKAGRGIGWGGKKVGQAAYYTGRGIGQSAKWTAKNIKKQNRRMKAAAIKEARRDEQARVKLQKREEARYEAEQKRIAKQMREVGKNPQLALPAVQQRLALKAGRQPVVNKRRLMAEQKAMIAEQKARQQAQKKANKEARKEALRGKQIDKYNSLLKEKLWKYKKYQAHAGKGSQKAIKRLSSTASEIAEIENKLRRLSS